MILATVVSHDWTMHRDVVQTLVSRLIEEGSPVNTVIDRDVVARELRLGQPTVALPAHVVQFSSWLKDGDVEDGMVDVQAIHRWVADHGTECAVVVDARGHRAELIERALSECRYSWFPLEQWHPAFVIVCDEPVLLRIAEALSTTFYCQPQLMADWELNRLIRRLERRASAYRWLGPGFAKWQQRGFKILDWVAERFDRAAERGSIKT
jgi:hypothetical protein